jgi:patatin-related protein
VAEVLLDPGQVDEKTRSRHAETTPDADGRYDVFTRRAFADGGYLDNKPFSYAVEAIAARRSDVPVDRKLLYIEPSPERVRDELAVLDAPNAVENVVKVFTLARYEAIREDLQAVLNRNRMIERVGRILEGTLDDIQGNPEKREPDSVRQWLDQDLEKMIDREGIGYGGYLRLRVAQLTDDLAEILTRQAGFDAGSDLFQAVREIVRVWRDRRFRYYVDGEKPGDARQSFNRFLQFYNLRFFTSRLRFTLHAIDRLFRLAGEKAVDGSAAFVAEEGWSRPLEVVERVKLEGRAAAFRERLKQIRGELSLRLEAIEQLRARLLHPGKDSELTRGVAQMALSGRKIVAEILEERSTARVRGAIDAFLETHAQALEGVADFIRDVVHRADVHSDLCKHTLGLGVLVEPGREGEGPPALRAALENYLREPVLSPRSGVRLETGDGRGRLPNRAPADPRRAAEWAAAFYFRKFPYYDIVAFPMLKSHEIGEEIDPVEVLRISPEDAQALSAAGGRKLGGSTLMHFGAFLDRTWRKNDILWGRLDGAERLITCLLSGTAHEGERERLIADAHRAIFEEVLQETLGPKDPAKVRQRGREMLDLLTASMLGKEPRDRSRVNEKLSRALTQKEIARMLEGVLKGNLDAERIRDLFRGHQIDRRLEPRPALQAIARSIEVVGRMLEAIAQDFSAQGRGRRAAAWITRVGRLLWGLVEAATPHSLARTFFRHWLVLIMAVAALLAFFGSAVSGEPRVGAFGLKVLLLAAVVFGVWSVFQGILAKRFRLLGAMAKSLAALFVLVSLSLAAIGAFRLPGILAGVWDRLKEVFNYLIP